jgi:hypothetical protein
MLCDLEHMKVRRTYILEDKEQVSLACTLHDGKFMLLMTDSNSMVLYDLTAEG